MLLKLWRNVLKKILIIDDNEGFVLEAIKLLRDVGISCVGIYVQDANIYVDDEDYLGYREYLYVTNEIDQIGNIIASVEWDLVLLDHNLSQGFNGETVFTKYFGPNKLEIVRSTSDAKVEYCKYFSGSRNHIYHEKKRFLSSVNSFFV